MDEGLGIAWGFYPDEPGAPLLYIGLATRVGIRVKRVLRIREARTAAKSAEDPPTST